MLKKKNPLGHHSSQKRGGWGVRRGMIIITDSMVFLKPSLTTSGEFGVLQIIFLLNEYEYE